MTLSASTHKAALTDHFADPFVRENVARLFDIVVTSWRSKVWSWRHFVWRNWCKKMDISMFLAVFSVRFWLESGKMWKNKSTFFIFTFFCRYSLFFISRARSTPGEGGTGKYQPWYQPPYQPSTWVLDRRAGQLYLNWLIRLCKSLVSRAILV